LRWSPRRYINWTELRRVFADVEQHNGAKGSPWKLYVDPVEHFLCFHNVQTGERVRERARLSAFFFFLICALFVFVFFRLFSPLVSNLLPLLCSYHYFLATI
jgi:hypothetical protein